MSSKTDEKDKNEYDSYEKSLHDAISQTYKTIRAYMSEDEKEGYPENAELIVKTNALLQIICANTDESAYSETAKTQFRYMRIYMREPMVRLAKKNKKVMPAIFEFSTGSTWVVTATEVAFMREMLENTLNVLAGSPTEYTFKLNERQMEALVNILDFCTDNTIKTLNLEIATKSEAILEIINKQLSS